ncbi:DUF6602 domain-containing protein [Paenibacillus planticolens]|uniref:DUF6602 domain-containing protein n=1 Tax=Paenibacillus planticolens TaxID=2654976 RepID=A0ABX1ZSK3_9BACL|nr:DUF6602 domain-containing protein [Paenibacillus planticolens]NOV02723.1 hypothetical protein [Paenibacillus planticolens]
MPNNNIRYQQSIAAEINSIKDRVRFFIEDNHWGEDGRYKELILMNYLKKVLPDNISVGTGFVKNARNELTDQIDILIYKKNDPKLFSADDFVILMPESVLGIVEVKSKVTPEVLCNRKVYNRDKPSTIDKCNRNGEIIGNRNIFNGIFSFERQLSFETGIRSHKLVQQLKEKHGYLNHICFDDNIFMRFWPEGNPIDKVTNNDFRSSFSVYDLSYRKIFNDNGPGLAYGYFISNILETVYRLTAPHVLNNQYFEFLYPIENTKESYRIIECEIKIDL